MTERIHSLTLVLAKDTRVDDVESLVSACRHLRGVVDVVPNVGDDYAQVVVRSRLHARLSQELYELLEIYRAAT